MRRAVRIIGIIASITYLAFYIHRPSYPTPDKLLIFLTFIFMAFNQAIDMLKRMLPFVVLLLSYDSFRSLVPSLNARVHYTLMPRFDIRLFGSLPTVTLQHWLWHGQVQWYDFIFYIMYMLHFVLPFALALVVWKLRAKQYWQYVTAYVSVSYAAFVAFLLYPTAPPWLASQDHLIPHITRISSQVWVALGISNAPSIYNHLAPNPVAAVPSLHAAYAVLFTLFVYKLFGKKWGTLSLIYPILQIIGVVYMGEHYFFDVLTGALFAVVAFLAAPYLTRQVGKLAIRFSEWVQLPKLRQRLAQTAQHGWR